MPIPPLFHTFPHICNTLSHTSPTFFHTPHLSSSSPHLFLGYFPCTPIHFPTPFFTFSHTFLFTFCHTQNTFPHLPPHLQHTFSHLPHIFSHPHLSSPPPHLFLGYFPCTPIHFPTPPPHFSTHSTFPTFFLTPHLLPHPNTLSHTSPTLLHTHPLHSSIPSSTHPTSFHIKRMYTIKE